MARLSTLPPEAAGLFARDHPKFPLSVTDAKCPKPRPEIAPARPAAVPVDSKRRELERLKNVCYYFWNLKHRVRHPNRPSDCADGLSAGYVRPYSRGQKNDFRDAEAIAEAVLRPTMKFVAIKTVEQLDLQGLHRVRERLVCQRTSVINQIRAFLLERGIAVRQGCGRCAPRCPMFSP